MNKVKSSIQSKISRAILITSTVVLTMAGLAYLAYEIYNYREDSRERMTVLGSVMANASTAALTFNSEDEANSVLSALKGQEYLIAAALYDENGKLFASFPKDVSQELLPAEIRVQGYDFQEGYLEGFQPVMLGEKQIGALYLRYDLREFSQQLQFYLIIAFAIFVISVLLAYVLSSRLQKRITRSIVALADTARAVAIHNNYSVRAQKQSNDETGLLTDAFNQMLVEIEHQSTALMESEKKFRTLADNIPIICWMSNEEGKVFWYNSRWYDYTGAAPVNGDKPTDMSFYRPEQVPLIVKTWEHSLHSKTMFDMIIDIRGKDGAFRQFLTRVTPLQGESGNVSQWFGTNTDISELRKFEDALRKSEEYNRTLVESSPDFIQALELNGNLLAVNSRGRAVFGVENPESFIGKPWVQMWNEKFHPAINEALNNARDGRTGQVQVYSETAAGDRQWWDILIAPINGNDSKPERLVAVSRDISKLKELEQQKNEFISIASHELKTPVTTIKAYVQLLQSTMDSQANAVAVGMLGKVDGQLNRLTLLISDLLDVSRMEQGRLRYRKEVVEITQVARNVISDIRQTSTSHDIVEEYSGDALVMADQERLGQVIINFLTNAIKYSPNSNRIIVRTTTTEKEVILSVQDFGLGLNEEERNKVFGRFYRVEGRGLETFPGLGLGLYIVSEIIKRHDGRLWVNSEIGQGSTFHFSIPLATVPQPVTK